MSSGNNTSFLRLIGLEPEDRVLETSESTEMAEPVVVPDPSTSQIILDMPSVTEPDPTERTWDKTEVHFRSSNVQEKTETYSPEEIGRTTLSDLAHELSVSKEISRTLDLEGGNTLTFDQMSEKSASGTAHFDYSEEKGDYRVVVLSGNANAQAFHLHVLPLRLGRDPMNEIVIEDANVSRFHAEIQDRQGEYVLVDMGSTNGVKVNGLRVKEQALNSHDVLQVGDLVLEFLAPGVLSKGSPQVAAAQATVSSSGRTWKLKRAHIVALSVLILAGVLWMFGSSLFRSAQDAGTQVLAQKAQEQVTKLKANLEAQFQKPYLEIEPDAVKKSFIAHLEASAMNEVLPGEVRKQLDEMPADVLKNFLEDEQAASAFISSGGDQKAFRAVVRARLSSLINQRRFQEALAVVNYLLKGNPDDATYLQIAEKLKSLSTQTEKQVEASISEDEEKFLEYMRQYENVLSQLAEQKRFDDAADYAGLVLDKIKELAEKEPFFDRMVQKEIPLWMEHRETYQKKAEVQKEKLKTERANSQEAADLFDVIKMHMDQGEVGRASEEMEKFLNEFPTHPKAKEVLTLRSDLEKSIQVSFATTKQNIEKFISAESYQNAWIELYRFMDLIPNHSDALELKASIERVAGAKALQYYNQARVFEFEADDLVAAEQYYKRSLETTDPKGELFKKAQRRLEDVRRKSIR